MSLKNSELGACPIHARVHVQRTHEAPRLPRATRERCPRLHDAGGIGHLQSTAVTLSTPPAPRSHLPSKLLRPGHRLRLDFGGAQVRITYFFH